MELKDTNTLKLIFQDNSSVLLPKWFTDQFEYFNNLLEETGTECVNEDDIAYKYLELDLRYQSELSRLLTKPILSFLKKYAYHTLLLIENESDDIVETNNDLYNNNWKKGDILQSKMILKFIEENNYDELFRIYIVANYLGFIPLCHVITDEIIQKTNGLNIHQIMDLFKLPNDLSLTTTDRNNIIKTFEWNEI